MNTLRRSAGSWMMRLIFLGQMVSLMGTLGRMAVLSLYLGQDILDQSGKRLLASHTDSRIDRRREVWLVSMARPCLVRWVALFDPFGRVLASSAADVAPCHVDSLTDAFFRSASKVVLSAVNTPQWGPIHGSFCPWQLPGSRQTPK